MSITETESSDISVDPGGRKCVCLGAEGRAGEGTEQRNYWRENIERGKREERREG